MSARLNLTVGVLTLSVMIATSLIGMYFIKTGKDSIDYSIQESVKVHDMMIQEIQEIQQKGNMRSNLTLQHFEQAEKQRQLVFNETAKLQAQVEHNILGNLTSHLDASNTTRDQLTKEHELMFRALNITKSETPNEEAKLGKLLKEFIDNKKVHEPQRPKVK